jgi:hypothetical protein
VIPFQWRPLQSVTLLKHVVPMCNLTLKIPDFNDFQCDQIGQNLDIRATLGYFLPNKFSQTQAVSRDGLL